MNIVLRDPSGIIATPGYRQGYQVSYHPHGHECHWKIIAPKGRVVRVEFSSFRLHNDQYQYVEIADRINGINSRTVKRTGVLPSFNFYSWGNELSVFAFGISYDSNNGIFANYTTMPTGQYNSLIASTEQNARM